MAGLSGVHLSETKFARATLRNANLVEVCLDDVQLTELQLQTAHLNMEYPLYE